MGWLKNKFWPQLRETLNEWQNDDTGQYAAALSFYTAFSFFPLILVLLSGLGWFLSTTEIAKQENIENYILEPVRKQAGEEAAKQLDAILGTIKEQLKTQASVGWSTGFFMLLLGAIGIFAQMESAFARIWKEYLPQPKPGIWPLIQRLLLGRLKAFVVVLGLGIFMVLTFLSSFLLSGIATGIDNLDKVEWLQRLKEWFIEIAPWFANLPLGSWTLRGMQFGTGVALNLLLFLFLYRMFSPRRIGWMSCVRGSIVASLLWELGRIGLTWYLLRGGYTAYGVIGSFIAIMLWFFYAWNVMFFGAEWGEVSWRLRDHHFNRDKEQSETSSAVRARDPLAPLPVLGTVASASNTPPGYEPISPKVDPEDRPENR
jgi:membrane protein